MIIEIIYYTVMVGIWIWLLLGPLFGGKFIYYMFRYGHMLTIETDRHISLDDITSFLGTGQDLKDMSYTQ